MYIPESFQVSSPEKIDAFLDKLSFATIITSDVELQVTHAPVLSRRDGDRMVLSIHFARANPHCQAILEDPSRILSYFKDLVAKYEGPSGLPDTIMPVSSRVSGSWHNRNGDFLATFLKSSPCPLGKAGLVH